MRTHITTIFDKNYLGRVLAFRASLREHLPEQEVHFLCLDDEAFELCQALKLEHTRLVRLADLNDAELMATRKTRTAPEFASTAKPIFLLHVMKSGLVKSDDLLTFIDPDFFFYESPEAVFKKMYDSGSIIITSHRFAKNRENERFEKGVFNAGFMGFRSDQNALTCLEEWRKQCIDWCYLRYEDGKIGDQGYLSDWPEKYADVYVLPDLGVNLSTWNIQNYKIKKVGSNRFTVDGSPLICYHFHGIRLYFDKCNQIHASPITIFHGGIYQSYVRALQEAYEKVQSLRPGWKLGTIPNPGLLRIMRQKIMRRLS